MTWDIPLKENCQTCGAFMLRHNLKNGKFNIICSNESCQTRENDIEKKANDNTKKTKDAKKSKITSRKSKGTTITKKTKSE